MRTTASHQLTAEYCIHIAFVNCKISQSRVISFCLALTSATMISKTILEHLLWFACWYSIIMASQYLRWTGLCRFALVFWCKSGLGGHCWQHTFDAGMSRWTQLNRSSVDSIWSQGRRNQRVETNGAPSNSQRATWRRNIVRQGSVNWNRMSTEHIGQRRSYSPTIGCY